jgi:hypothetical protein
MRMDLRKLNTLLFYLDCIFGVVGILSITSKFVLPSLIIWFISHISYLITLNLYKNKI